MGAAGLISLGTFEMILKSHEAFTAHNNRFEGLDTL